jgi:hypothetical protein
MIYLLFFLLTVLALPTIIVLFGILLFGWKAEWTRRRFDESEDCDLSDLK